MKILFVHEDVVDAFIEKFNAKLATLKPGMPWDSGVALTPLPESGKVDYLHGLVADAQSKGAQVVNPNGGESRESFLYPAVLYPVTPQMRVYNEEQFGPVVPIVPYRHLDTVIDYVLESDFGQQLSLFGTNPVAIGRLVDTFANQVGRINLNAQCQRGPDTYPFNGRRLRRGHAVGTRCTAGVFDPHTGGNRVPGQQQGADQRNHSRPRFELPDHRLHLLTRTLH